MSFKQRFFYASAITLISACANAADLTPPAPAPSPGWVVTVGLGPDFFTSFPGAKSVSIWPTGYLTYHRPGEPEPFISPDDGFGIALLDLPWIKAGPVARFISQRTLSGGFGVLGNNDSFYGLHNIGFTAELGGFLELWPTSFFRARLEARQGVSGAQGFDGNVELDLVGRYDAFTAAIGPRFRLGDDQFVGAYFSVSPFEAFLNPNLYPYQAVGGLVSVGGAGSIKYQFSPEWSVTAFGTASRFVGSAGGSPIPNRVGSLIEFSAGAVLAYTFNFNWF